MDVDERTFPTEVIGRSRETPVVVDFWAAWCAPCCMLGPVLEREVAEREGAIALAKVDVDASPGLAAEYGVRGIPAVKAFRNGRVVAEFVGAQPAHRVAAFLDGLAGPSGAERVLAELRESEEDGNLVAALEAGDFGGAFERLLQELPGADAERRERIRQIMVALFGELGQDHPLSLSYRRRLATALF